jgi:hypothetical protein
MDISIFETVWCLRRLVQTPCHLEHRLAVNKAQILAHITYHQKPRRTGQRDITDFFPPINLPNAANFPPPPSVTPRSDSSTNAPLTSGPGEFAEVVGILKKAMSMRPYFSSQQECVGSEGSNINLCNASGLCTKTMQSL